MRKLWRRAIAASALAAALLPTASYGFDVDLTKAETLRALGIKTVADIPVGKTGFLLGVFGFCHHDGHAFVSSAATLKDSSDSVFDKVLIMRSGENEVGIDILPAKDPKEHLNLNSLIRSVAQVDCIKISDDGTMGEFYSMTTISGHKSLSEAIKDLAP